MHASSIQRYCSYPTADRFTAGFTYRDYLQAVASLRTRGSARPLALCVNLPLCATEGDGAAVYLSYLKREIDMQARLFAGMNHVEQLYIGGDTPTCLSDAQMAELMLHLRHCFQFAPDGVGDYAIRVDPRVLSPQRVHALRRQGFNRITLGMRARDCYGHPLQAVIDAARAALFRSVGIELQASTPAPDPATMAQALARVIKAAPDHIVLHDQGHPCAAMLVAAGYVHIGLDDFALAGDELTIAQRQGRLHRNVHGYSTHADLDLIACGASAISAVAATYSQNVSTLDTYYDLIDRNELPVERGIRLAMDDALRRAIIQMLMCQFELSIPAIEQAYPIVFADYFAAELDQLAVLERDGLVTLEPDWLTVTARGRVEISRLCMLFDRYLGAA